MDRLPTGFDTTPIAPIIFIFDHKFNLKFKWEHPQFNENPTQDFNLTSWNVSTGINSTAGESTLIIEDNDNILNDGTNKANSGINAGDLVQIHLGKSFAAPWFFGICDEPEVFRPGYNQKTIEVNVVGYSSRLATKHISIDHHQRFTVNGEIDERDNNAKVSSIVRRILTDDTIILQPPHDRNLSYDIDDIDLKIERYTKSINTTQADAIGELANVANAIYGVDPRLKFFFHPANISSGYVITNDLSLDIDVNKMLIIRNTPYSYRNSSVSGAYTNLIGTNMTQLKQLYPDNMGTSPISVNSSINDYTAFRLPYKGSSMGVLQIAFTRIPGTTMFPRIFVWVGYLDAIDDRLSGDSIIYFEGVQPGRLNSEIELNGTGFLSFEINRTDLDPEKDIYVFFADSGGNQGGIIQPYTNPNRNVGYRRITNTGGVFTASEESPGELRTRLMADQSILLKAQNQTLKHIKLTKENKRSFRDTPNSSSATHIFEGLMDTAGRVRRTYSGMVTSVPMIYPPLGELYRIIDRFNGLDSYALLIGFELGADTSTNLNTINMNLELEEWLT